MACELSVTTNGNPACYADQWKLKAKRQANAIFKTTKPGLHDSLCLLSEIIGYSENQILEYK